MRSAVSPTLRPHRSSASPGDATGSAGDQAGQQSRPRGQAATRTRQAFESQYRDRELSNPQGDDPGNRRLGLPPVARKDRHHRMESTLAPAIPAVDRAQADGSGVPVLDAAPGGPADRFAVALGGAPSRARLPRGGARRAGADRGVFDRLGLPAHRCHRSRAGVGRANRHFDAWLAAHRTPCRTEASLIGSIAAGGVVLPIVAGLVAVVCALPPQVADRGFRRLLACGRVGGLPRHDARRPRAPAARPSPREPAGERELPVRPHGRLDRGLRRARAAAHLADQSNRAFAWPRLVGRRGDADLRRVCRACTAGCTIRST